MTDWFHRKTRDLRHAVQELRTGDDIDPKRSAVRTTIVGGRPPTEDAVSAVPMGIERVLRRAAVDARFGQRLLSDRQAAIDGSGLELTSSERMILLAAPAEQIERMVDQIGPGDPSRRSLLRRLAAAAGMALFGVATMTTLQSGIPGEFRGHP